MGASNGKKLINDKERFSTYLMQIKIIMNSILFWEKTFNIEITFEQIYKDFISEHFLEKDFSINWYYNDKIIEFNSKKLKQFAEENNISNFTTIELTQKVFEIEKNQNIVESLDYIANPIYNPFSLFIYNIKQNTTKIKIFEEKLTLNNEQIKFGIESTYCNGGNHFFIFGGINTSTGEELGMFLDIDLINENIINKFNITPKKRNHSMLYSQNKVYIVGGNSEKTMIYDLENNTIANIGDLNIRRFEPSLIRHSNYLYCFDASRKNDNKYSFEKINLKDIPNSSWELIYPKISPTLSHRVFNQKFFGVVEDNNFNIIFLGGLYINNSEDNSETNSTIYNLKYNLVNNTMEKSDIPFQEISLNEKTFLPLDENIYFIMYNTLRQKSNIVKYYKNNNKVEISPLDISEFEEINKKSLISSYRYTKLNNSLNGFNFDMPGTSSKNIKEKIIINNDENQNTNTNLNEKIENNKKILENQENKLNNEEKENENNDHNPHNESNKISEHNEDNESKKNSKHDKINENNENIETNTKKEDIHENIQNNDNIKDNKEETEIKNNGEGENLINTNINNSDIIKQGENINLNQNNIQNININNNTNTDKPNENNINKTININNNQDNHQSRSNTQVKKSSYFSKFHNCVNANDLNEVKIDKDIKLKSAVYANKKYIKKKEKEILNKNNNDVDNVNY